VVKFLTRPGCHLCDEARPVVTSVAARAGVGIEEIDIDSDPVLTRDFGLRIPVLLAADGRVLAEGEIDSRRLRKQLRRERAG
jgi:thiol-disulfide isomerase/thioredoxin